MLHRIVHLIGLKTVAFDSATSMSLFLSEHRTWRFLLGPAQSRVFSQVLGLEVLGRWRNWKQAKDEKADR